MRGKREKGNFQVSRKHKMSGQTQEEIATKSFLIILDAKSLTRIYVPVYICGSDMNPTQECCIRKLRLKPSMHSAFLKREWVMLSFHVTNSRAHTLVSPTIFMNSLEWIPEVLLFCFFFNLNCFPITMIALTLVNETWLTFLFKCKEKGLLTN